MADARQMLIEIVYDDDKGTPVLRANSAAVEKYGDQIKKLNTQFKGYNQTQGNTHNLTKATNLALLDTGRVVQDLPYGIRGVANNIDPLIQSFQRLKTETGSNRQAIKALIGGLSGPAGLAIAVSAITSILVAFGPQIKNFFKEFASGAKDVEKAKEELEALQDISKSIAGDLGISESDALEGVKEIIELIESQQTIRDAIAGTVSNSGIVLSGDQARRSAYQEALEEVNAAIAEQSEFVKSLDENQRTAILERIEKLKEEAELRENIKQLMIETNQEAIKLQGDLLTEKARSSVDRADRPTYLEDFLEYWDEELKDLPTADSLTKGLDLSEPAFAGARGINALTNALQEYGYTLDQINGMSVEQAQYLLQQARNAEYLSNMISGQLVSAYASGAEAVGAFAATGSDEEPFLDLQTQVADFMSTFGQQLIALGLGSLALRQLFANPFAAIAAGTALVIAAGAVRADAQKRLNNLTGGSGTTQNTVIGYRGVGSGSGSGAAATFPDQVAVVFEDGTDGIVASGTMKLQRQGWNGGYLGS